MKSFRNLDELIAHKYDSPRGVAYIRENPSELAELTKRDLDIAFSYLRKFTSEDISTMANNARQKNNDATFLRYAFISPIIELMLKAKSNNSSREPATTLKTEYLTSMILRLVNSLPNNNDLDFEFMPSTIPFFSNDLIKRLAIRECYSVVNALLKHISPEIAFEHFLSKAPDQHPYENILTLHWLLLDGNGDYAAEDDISRKVIQCLKSIRQTDEPKFKKFIENKDYYDLYDFITTRQLWHFHSKSKILLESFLAIDPVYFNKMYGEPKLVNGNTKPSAPPAYEDSVKECPPKNASSSSSTSNLMTTSYAHPGTTAAGSANIAPSESTCSVM